MAKKILVIDDDLFIRDIYNEVLTNAGFDTEIAINGEEGLKKLTGGGYDMTLLDMVMPDVGGLDVLKKLKNIKPEKKNGPIILLTNMTDDQSIKEGLENGAKAFFVKSDLTPDQLVEKVNNNLPPN